MKYSIVIPTAFDKCEKLLKPCVESIRKFTDLSDTEVLVVANGCTDGTVDYVQSLGTPFDVLIRPDPVGYPRAVNMGIEATTGDYIVLLNNDTILLEQPRNAWIDILTRAFWDDHMAIAGPWMNWCPHAERDFLIFFCVMIRRSILDAIGLLDEEAFGVGYGEDCDLCCKAVEVGYKIAQVPVQEKLAYDGQMAIGQFPIYHAGNKTFANWPGGEALLARNRDILRQRYSCNIGRARALDGWISDYELGWLSRTARNAEVAIEIGSWHGKSTRAIADNLPKNGRLYAVDTWQGSKVELETNHVSARLMDGDHAFDEFARGLWDHIESGKVVPIRMHGKHAAKLLLDMGVKADFIFIDGGHAKGETKEDIESFFALRKAGGIISGHDYMHSDGIWPDVTLEVLEAFGGNIGQPKDTHIWYTDSDPIDRQPQVFDCFPFNNELSILRRRLETLYEVVDRFVIVEATKTHSGKAKELVFDMWGEMYFAAWLNKITYIVVDDIPELEGTATDKSWARERHQRDAIMRGLTQCRDNDIIIISDCDEIPSPSAIRSYDGSGEVRSFDMDLFYYNHETKAKDKWREAKIAPYHKVKELTPCGIRYIQAEPIPDGGEHLSYFGGVDSIIEKIDNTAHQEYATDYWKNPERIRKAINEKRDLFDRDYVEFVK